MVPTKNAATYVLVLLSTTGGGRGLLHHGASSHAVHHKNVASSSRFQHMFGGGGLAAALAPTPSKANKPLGGHGGRWRPASATDAQRRSSSSSSAVVPYAAASSSHQGDDGGVGISSSEKGSLGGRVTPRPGWFETYVKISEVLTNLFPLWTLIFSAWGLARPQDYAWLTTEYFTAGLAVLMLSMGITMTPNDFVRVASRPNAVLVNFLLCYGFMPLLGLSLGNLFRLDPALVAGMVLVGSINGGQASNLCTFIANGNVALSVLMTTATTVGAIFMTPFLCQKLLGEVVPVNAVGIVVSTLQVVLGPIVLGMGLNVGAPRLVDAVKPITPLIGVAATCLLVASSVGQVAGPIKAAGLSLQVPVFLVHFLGGIFGYWIARLLGFGETTCRTMAIETSMKSSAFGFLLAKLHFGADAARVPSAVSVVWMALVGSSLAVAWRFMPVEPPKFDRAVKDKFDKQNVPSLLKRLFGRGGGSSSSSSSSGTAAPL